MQTRLRQGAACGSRRAFCFTTAAQQQCRCKVHHRSKYSTACSTAAAVHTSAYDLLSVDATPYIGPIQIVEVEGAGRGVVVTRDVQAGELLLCCHPLAVVTGPQQQRLGVDQLQVQLATNISPAVTAWLHQLYDGTTRSTQQLPDLQAAVAVQQQQQAQAALLQSLRQQQDHLSSSSSSSGGGDSGCCGSDGGSSGHQQLLEVTDALLQRIMDVVRYNAYSDLHDDLAAAAAAAQDPVSLIGLYPEFSFFNHSCVPNCINWVLPGEPRAMVVRAARNIPAGEQATISYLGGPQLLPLSGRQQALGNFGFVCRCDRCIAEEEVPDDIVEQMEDIVSRAYQSFTPRLQEAAADGDTAAAAKVRRQALSMMTVLYSQLRRHLIRPQLRQQLLASCFSCLEVIADAAAAEGDATGEAEGLQKCLEAAAAVTPGSDLHCILAAKLEAVLASSSGSSGSGGGGGGGDRLLAAAGNAVAAAHCARYGRLSEEQLQRLAELNRTLYV